MDEPPVAWTVDEACAWFAESGVPIEPDRLRLVIRGLQLPPTGETASGPQGGRGKPTYPVDDLMTLHAWIAKWKARNRGASGTPRQRAGP